MARKKGFLERLIDDRAKAKARREREERQAALRAQKVSAAAEKERVRAAEQARRREAAAQVAKEKAAERERVRRAAAAKAAEQERIRQHNQEARRQREAKAAAAAEATRRQREQAQIAKEQALRKRQELADEARRLTDGVEQRIRELDEVLRSRPLRPVAQPWVLEGIFNQEGVEAFLARLEAALRTSAHPWGVPSTVVVRSYRPEARELIVERHFPRVGVIPTEVHYGVMRDELRATPRKPAEVAKRYERLLASLVLRTIDEVFKATPATLVDSIVFDGRVTAVDPATGKSVTPLLVSLQVERTQFEEIRLNEPELDPVMCLKAQNAVLSPHPGDLVAVKPILYYDLERYKTIQHVGLALDLDSRLDLLSLSPNEFEVLIRELFEARGLKSWQTQSSRDEGIDAVAINEDPVLGGLAIIQAKRYAKVVGYESVTALAGVMDYKRAVKGILVTTSWVGKASRDFANANGRMQIIEGRELKLLFAEHLNMDVLINLPVLPPGWQRAEVA